MDPQNPMTIAHLQRGNDVIIAIKTSLNDIPSADIFALLFTDMYMPIVLISDILIG